MAVCAARLSGISTKPAAGAAGLAVGHSDGFYCAIRLEELAQVLLRRGKSQVAHKTFTHGSPAARVHIDAPASAPSLDSQTAEPQ